MEFTTLYSGSSGNCSYIRGGETRILVDVGGSMRQTAKALAEIDLSLPQIDGIFITHEHKDHIAGVLTVALKHQIPVYASPQTWKSFSFATELPQRLKRVFTYNMELGDLTIDFFKISHDAIEPVGMVFHFAQQAIGYSTDTGQMTKGMKQALKGVNGLIFEANHSVKMLKEGPYPYFLKQRVLGTKGHLSNQQSALGLANIIDQHTQAVILAHLSEVNNTPQMALRETISQLELLDFNYDCSITTAPKKEPHPLIIIK